MTAAATYDPPQIWQGGTFPCPWQNCNPDRGVMQADLETLGALKANLARVGIVRKWVDTTYDIGCVGTTLTQVNRALLALYKIPLEYRFDVPTTSLRTMLQGGHSIGGVESYRIWHGTPYDYSPTFNGGHAILYSRARWNATAGRWEWLRHDPLRHATTGQWVPEYLAIRALEALFTDHNAEFTFGRSRAAAAPKMALYAHDVLGSSSDVGTIRLAPKASATGKGPVRFGDLYTHVGIVSGGSWTINGKTGSSWLAVTQINGKAVSSLFGATVTRVYVALGWVTGPTGAV